MALPEKRSLPGQTHQVRSWDVVTHWLAVTPHVMSVDINNIGCLHGSGYDITFNLADAEDIKAIQFLKNYLL